MAHDKHGHRAPCNKHTVVLSQGPCIGSVFLLQGSTESSSLLLS